MVSLLFEKDEGGRGLPIKLYQGKKTSTLTILYIVAPILMVMLNTSCKLGCSGTNTKRKLNILCLAFVKIKNKIEEGGL